MSEDLHKRLIPAWPRALKKDRSRFELLKRAYVEARYSEHYEISSDDLATLAAGAERLRELVNQASLEWLAKLKSEA